MRRWILRIIPSMFHRRLAIVAVGTLVVIAMLGLQLTRLTVAQGDQWRDRAESVMWQTRLVPTSRGTIYDNRMRPLATEVASDDLAVQYNVITGQWAYQRARRAAYLENRRTWQELSFEEREELIARYQRPFDEQTDSLWRTLARLGDLDRSVLDERRATLMRRVQRIANHVWSRQLEDRRDAGRKVDFAEVAQPVGEQRMAHPMLIGLEGDPAVEAGRLIAKAAGDADNIWSQVELVPSRKRHNPLTTMTVLVDTSTFPTPLRQDAPVEVTVEGVGLQIIGQMREAWKQDMDRRPYRRPRAKGDVAPDDGDSNSTIDPGGYLPGDEVGGGGVEASMEDWLRGTRGRVVERLDSGHQERTEPMVGRDVVLTIDMQLQARVMALMSPALGLMKVQPWQAKEPTAPLGTPLNGAAVVIDIARSEVLAAVSMPTYTLDQLENDPESIWRDEVNQPWLNRVVARPYAPGSTMKPLVYVSTVTERRLGAMEPIVCTGHLYPNSPDKYRCWIYKHYHTTHGPMAGDAAIEQSCNIFFYNIGRRMGADRLIHWYQQFGIGRDVSCGLPEAVPGILPPISDDEKGGSRPEYEGILMGIGQGPISCTPLQAAAAYATIARDGYYISPTFVSFPGATAGGAGQDGEGRVSYDLGLDRAAVRTALRGLTMGVNERDGTSHHITLLEREPVFTIDGVTVMGKSGTATASPQWIDRDDDGHVDDTEIVRRGDHAWFVGLVQRKGESRPAYAIAVIVEFGGSGGATAGPIANQILHAMRAEGYL